MVLVVRPVLHFVHEAIVNQAIVPQTTNMIRWRTHSYTLGHAVSYFQSDFAGRLANRITQAGPALREAAVEVIDRLWYVAIYAFTALGAFSTTSVWLALPTLGWIAGYTALIWYFVPRAQERSRNNADKRSVLVGRIVDSYTNILTVKLFARGAEERSAVRDAIAAHTRAFLHSLRLITGVNAALQVLNSVYLVADGGHRRLALVARRDDAGRDRGGSCARAPALHHVGLGDAGRARGLREHRHHPGEHGNHRPAARHPRSARERRNSGSRRARCASRTSPSITVATRV